MDKIYILCVEDQREVLSAILRDLESLEPVFALEGCESAPEAAELMDEIDARGDLVGLIVCDHVMPDKSGVDFLIEVNEDGRFSHTKKILLTGLATHQDTIHAINQASIDRYIEKPWDADHLQGQTRRLLTLFILDQGLPYEKYLSHLDTQTLFERLRK
jgi:two-component system, chemotaxis family, chemotaxis protein CheY